MTRDPKLVAAVSALCEAFNRSATAATFAAYTIGLDGLTGEQVEAAAAIALRRCRYMPVPAELRELALTGGLGFEDQAERAFNVLRKAVQVHGADRSVNFADSAINAAVRRIGGWRRVCNLPCEEFDKWLRKDFVAAYVSVLRNGASDDERAYLAGEMERGNVQWIGREMPNGERYALGLYGSAVAAIGIDYAPAMPSLPPVQRKQISHVSDFGLNLKGMA